MFKINLILVSVFLICCNSKETFNNSKKNNFSAYYKVECKHPRGTIKEYVISQYEYNYVYKFRSGIFDFKDINGLEIKANNCFTTNVKVEI